MKNSVSAEPNYSLRLLLVLLAICLLAVTGSSSAEAGRGFHSALIGKMDPDPNEDEYVGVASRNWYQYIRNLDEQRVNHFGWHGNPPLSFP